MKKVVFLLLSLFFLSGSLCAEQTQSDSASAVPAYVPTADYQTVNICGWNCRIAPDLIQDAPLYEKVARMLELQFRQIQFVVPASAVEKIKSVPLWIQKKDPVMSIACFHVSEDWLKQKGLNPDKVRGVDIPNAQLMLDEYDRQPMLVFHELSHAYHLLFLDNGYDNAAVIDAYKNAMEKKRYDKVLTFWQTEEKAYAATNPMEYFAELSECYFGENDFYPFVKAEFRVHDPEGVKMIEELWNK